MGTNIMLSVPQLVNAIKALINKGDHATDKAEQYYKAAGTHLKTLKEHKPDDVTWEKFVKIKCGLAQTRADELIRITDGKTTLERVRANKAESMRRLRAKQQAPRGAGNNVVAETACDVDWKKISSFDLGDPTQAYRAQAERYRTEAIHLATAYPLLANGVNLDAITQSEIRATQKVADAWLDVVNRLTSRRQ